MNRILLIPLFFCSLCSYAQTFVQGSVKDLKTGAPLVYCAVAVKGSEQGCITNEEGVFRILVPAKKDSLVFSSIGYKTLIVPITILADGAVFLESNPLTLKEVVIHGDDDYLYNILEKCRNKLGDAEPQISKVYLNLETRIENQPAEMLECYYNGYTQENTIEKLLLKNGRIGLAETDDHGFFVSLNTSGAIRRLNLTRKNDYMPFVPFQFNKSRLIKLYDLNSLSSGDDSLYHIRFSPRKNNSEYFSGEVWVDKETFSVIKIELAGENLSIHPFLPFREEDSIGNISISISQSYIKRGNHSLLNYIHFNYQLEYKDSSAGGRVHPSIPLRHINTSCMMYFYDYGKPFVLPYFKYDTDLDDYRKISLIPYNEYFWDNSNGLLYTAEQKKMQEFFGNNGMMVNFSNEKKHTPGFFNNFCRDDTRGFFENNNICWSGTARVSFTQNEFRRDSLLKEAKDQPTFESDRYQIKAQIFLDVNPAGDSIQHYSATIFNVFETYYDLPKETFTDCFINIYFDICEIERRNMEKALSVHNYSLAQIDSVYQQALKAAEAQTNLYLKKVQLGKNRQELTKWNDYVLENLDVDNIKLFGIDKK